MRQHILISFLLIVFGIQFIPSELLSQNGNPYVTHYQLPDGVSNQNWGFVQGTNGLMYVLNRKGVYSFDGLQWENLGIYGRPIAIAHSNFLFYSTDRGVGYFEINSDGNYSQQLLMETKENNFFYKFTTIPNGLLVISPTTICSITTSPDINIDTLYFESRPEVFISDFFELDNKFYHVKNKALIYLNKPDGGYEMLAGLPIGVDMTFSFIHAKFAFFGATNNRLYRFDGKRLSPFSLKDQNYLNASIPTSGISINEKSFALATLNGGALLINSEDGSTVNTLNFFNGLPDDEIYALGKDTEGGLWMSHGMGISRADLSIPIKSFGFYQGLRGNVLSSIEHKGTLYVGCSEGLFFLAEQKDYKAVDVTVRREPSKPKTVDSKSEPQQASQEETIEEKKKGFLSRLFNRRSERAEDSEQAAKSTQETAAIAEDRALPPLKRTIYQLQSISHSYTKVKGLQGKVRQLLVHNQKLYAATNLGFYEVEGGDAKYVIKDMNITYVDISQHEPESFIIGTDVGAYTVSRSRGKWSVLPIIEGENHYIVSAIEVDEKVYLISNEFDVLLAKQVSKGKYEIKNIPIPGTEFGNPIVRWVDGKAMAFSSSGAYFFNPESEELISDNEVVASNFSSILFNQPNYSWFRVASNWQFFSSTGQGYKFDINLINLLESPNYIHVANDSTILVVNGYSQVYMISSRADDDKEPLSIFFKSLVDKEGNLLSRQNIQLNYTNNSLKVRISAPSYIKQGSVEFQYMISGIMEGWSEWNNNPNQEFPFIPSGKYIVSIRAKDILGNISNTIDFAIEIKPPFWKRAWFISICIMLVLVLFYGFVKIREQNLRREKEILEQKVKERTKTIEEQKEILKKQRDDLEIYNKEILQQKEEIEAQRDEISLQRDKIFKQNEEITQSIAYARRIQTAVMPSQQVVESMLSEYFILFRPRDIVSGDFYWIAEKDEYIIVAAADSTGHGVPGAFMSMMGVSFLNDIVSVEGVVQPERILKILRQKIISTLWQTGKEGENRDGMDMAICMYHKDMKKVVYAGAYNPLYIVRGGELIEYKADKMPVGVHPKQELDFTTQTIDLKKGDNLYIFSDGFVDQFGGPDGRKFMAKPFKQLLTTLQKIPMAEQKQTLEDTLDKWQAAYDQVDDILIIGIAIK